MSPILNFCLKFWDLRFFWVVVLIVLWVFVVLHNKQLNPPPTDSFLKKSADSMGVWKCACLCVCVGRQRKITNWFLLCEFLCSTSAVPVVTPVPIYNSITRFTWGRCTPEIKKLFLSWSVLTLKMYIMSDCLKYTKNVKKLKQHYELQ